MKQGTGSIEGNSGSVIILISNYMMLQPRNQCMQTIGKEMTKDNFDIFFR